MYKLIRGFGSGLYNVLDCLVFDKLALDVDKISTVNVVVLSGTIWAIGIAVLKLLVIK